MDDNDRDFLINNIHKAQGLIDAGDVDGLLEAIDGFMTERGYSPPDYSELSDLGRQAERVYDRIYGNNY